MPDAKIYFNGAWHTLAGQKVRQNGEWVTIPRAGRIRINGAWADLHTHVWNYTSSTDTCSDCGATLAHVHKWNSYGRCETCGSVCLHDWIHNAFTPTKSTCAICGKVCTHLWDSETGKCNTCGKTCSHLWDSETGKCNWCKQEHTHTKWIDISDGKRRCTGCLKVCDHSDGYKSGPEYDTCIVCGYQVPHIHKWYSENIPGHDPLSGHICFNCRTVEAHMFDEYGICSVCGYVCSHDNSDDGICSVCGLTKSTRLLLTRGNTPYTVILNGTTYEVPAGDGYVSCVPQTGDNTFQIVQAVFGYRFKGFVKNAMSSMSGEKPKVEEPFTITFEKNRQATFNCSLD